jgi:hypothetical protein
VHGYVDKEWKPIKSASVYYYLWGTDTHTQVPDPMTKASITTLSMACWARYLFAFFLNIWPMQLR